MKVVDKSTFKEPKEVEKKGETPDIDSDEKTIDLRSKTTKLLEKKVKTTYDLIDDELKVITLDNDLVVKLIANNKGVFVDFRKYYKGYPTKKGIRIIATKFKEVAKVLIEDITKLVPNASDLSDLNQI